MALWLDMASCHVSKHFILKAVVGTNDLLLSLYLPTHFFLAVKAFNVAARLENVHVLYNTAGLCTCMVVNLHRCNHNNIYFRIPPLQRSNGGIVICACM